MQAVQVLRGNYLCCRRQAHARGYIYYAHYNLTSGQGRHAAGARCYVASDTALEDGAGRPHSTRSYNVLISSCARRHAWRAALDLLKEMHARSIHRNASTFSSAVSALQKKGYWEVAVALLEAMIADAVRPDVVNYNTVISTCAASGQWRQAFHLLGSMQGGRTTPDSVSYNATIAACNRAALAEHAIRGMTSMRGARVLPDAVTYGTVASAVGKLGDWLRVLRLFASMEAERLSQDSVCYSVAIGACEKASSWDAALRLFREMRTRQIPRDVVVFGNALSAHARASRWPEALALAQAMRSEAVQPDTVACNTLLGACARGSRWQEALAVVHNMGALHIRKTAVTCNALIRTLELSRQHRKAIAALIAYFPTEQADGGPTAGAPASIFRNARPDAVTPHMREAIAERLERALCYELEGRSADARPCPRPTVAAPASGGGAAEPGPAALWQGAAAGEKVRAVLAALEPDRGSECRLLGELAAELRSALPQEWVGAEVVPYGSSTGGFAVSGADIDVSIGVPVQGSCPAQGEGLRSFQQGALLRLRRSLLELGWDVSAYGLGGRVPVLSARWGRLDERTVDITVRNELGLLKSALLRDYAHLDSRLCDLVRMVKHWARQRSVYGQSRGFPGGYSYTLLAIFFAQNTSPPLVPSLQLLAPQPSLWTGEGGTTFDVAWLPATSVKQQEEASADCGAWTSAALVHGFFDFYGRRFDHAREVASVRLGCRALRAAPRAGAAARLSLEDPLETEWDLGAVLDAARGARLQAELRRAARLLAEAAAGRGLARALRPRGAARAGEAPAAGARSGRPPP